MITTKMSITVCKTSSGRTQAVGVHMKIFGDCVKFDMTYKTNKFHMPLGVFIGVNHHLQSTIFAVALIRDEKIPSFEWVFRIFLRCMNNKKPICMLTSKLIKKERV